jgi:Cytochrome c554 and c-prime
MKLVLLGLALVLLVGCAAGCGASEPGIAGATDAKACGSCHTTEYAAWSGSRLAASGTSPVFRALAARAGEAWGADSEKRCISCHQPGFGGDHGIGCVACHSATGNLENRDGLLVVDTTAPVAGPFADPLATPAHGSDKGAFLESPDLCGTCHEVTGPALFREPTLDEFQSSPQASTGATCVTCHMPLLSAAPIATGSTTSRIRASHSFVGFDPPWGASPDQAASAAAETLALLEAGLGLTATRGRSGSELDVTLANRAGHAVPTGVTFVRSLWVDVEFTGNDGRTLTMTNVIALGSQPTRKGVPVALLTEADAVTAHELAPGLTTSARVIVPDSLVAPVEAVATLRGRAVRPEVLDALGLAGMSGEVPTHEVASVTVLGLNTP